MDISNIKEILELVRKGTTIKDQRKIIELEETVISLHEENINLKSEILSLKHKLEIMESGERCPKCKKPSWNLIGSKPHPDLGELGVSTRTYKCSECGFSEDKLSAPSTV